MVHLVKNLPVIHKALGWEDSLEKEMATCSSIFIWRIPWTEEPDGLWVHKESDMIEWLTPPLPLHLNRLVRKQVHTAHCEDYLDIGLYVIHK